MARFEPLTLPRTSKRPTKAQIEVLPTPNEVCYEPPAPTRKPENKACSNCALWVGKKIFGSIDRCLIHSKDQVVFGWDCCSYHVPGIPAKRMLPIVMDPPLMPAQTGLGLYPLGTRCGKCVRFAPTSGVWGECFRVREDNRLKLATVHEFGCCARYVGARP